MLAFNLINILARAVSDRGIIYVFPWTMVLFVWSCFLGFFCIYRRGRDITVDFIVDRLGPRLRVASRLVNDGIVIAMMGLLVWLAPATLESQAGIIDMVGFERYVLSVPFFASCLLILVNTALDVWRALLGDPPPGGVPVVDP